MENTAIQSERDKMLYSNQKRVSDNEKQELQDKITKTNNQIKEDQEIIQKLQIEIEHKKSSFIVQCIIYLVLIIIRRVFGFE